MPTPARPAPAAAPMAPSSIGTLETILKRVAGDKDVQITRTSTGALLMRATGDTAFRTGSSSLTPAFSDFLKQLANGLQTYGHLSMKVTGHTDNTGDAQLNEKLSEARAASTINFLVSQGVGANRMLAEGKGQADPIASNDTAEGRASNRRVDMLIIELPR
ncbi:MAG: OmpA family protein [Ideonella sp.]